MNIQRPDQDPAARQELASASRQPQPAGERLAQLIDWKPVADNPSLIGRATIAFGGGWIVNSIPIFRRGDGSLSAGAPSMPIVGTDGTHQRDEAGKRRYVAIITFADRAARTRWDRAVLAALEAAGIGGGAP